jgi:hypothetical protein
MRRRVILAGLCLWGLTSGKAIDGRELLTAQISPRIAPAPGFIIVRAFVDASDDNRGLEVVAQSNDFMRSSTIELDGGAAPRLNVFEFSNLPAGEYEVRAALLGTNGVRATMARTVLIVAGARR